jgi:hypothetical protein
MYLCVGMLRQHPLNCRLQRVGMRGDDAPEDDLAHPLILVPQLVANRADSVPGHVGIGGEVIVGNAPHRSY